MNVLGTGALLLLSLLTACGDQLVEFPLGDASPSGVDASGVDASGADATGADADASRPTVVSTTPPDTATNVSVNKHVRVTFSRAMNPATITTTAFTVRQGAIDIEGDVTFTPTRPFDPSVAYTATATTQAEDEHGNALASDHVWTFTTGACSQLPVALHTAGSFAVLAGSTVTSTGLTTIIGDLGVSPGTAVTGFPPATVVGSVHAGDPTAAQASQDATTAYNDAAGRVLCPVTVAGNLGGRTLAPGLYVSTSSLEISSGDLTLDAQGDEDAVFIFQMASTLTTTAGRRIILSGGARATNVFWQVGSSATLGTTSVFHGTILADQAITMGTGAALNGRLLARIAAVALDSNPIATPAP
jgi:hypothetical protein